MKTFSKRALLRASAAPAILGASLIATAAFAQDAPQAADAEAADTIIVTGSLIKNPNLAQSTPVLATTSDEIDLRQSNNAEQLLREIPGVVPSIGSAVNNGNGGASTLDLRGLGSNRNLVLVDGRRMVPYGLGGVFDLNNIPLALVERVDVLTGGASTTYGADAIAGVANFILKKDFSGFEANLSEQLTEQGDGNTFRADVTMGANFDDGRGNAVFSIGYQEVDPVYQGDRSFSSTYLESYLAECTSCQGSGTSTPTRMTLPGVGTRQISADGNSLVPTYQTYNFNPYNIFQTPFKRFNMFGSANYEISDSVKAYTRGMFSKNTVNTIIAPSGAFALAVEIPYSNPYLTDGIRNQFCNANGLTAAQCSAAATAPSMIANPLAGQAGQPDMIANPDYRTFNTTISRRAVEAGPRISEFKTTFFDYALGFQGDIGSHLSWDVGGSYGESEQVQTQKGYTLNSRFQQALLATATEGCLDSSNGCVPVNIFGPTGSITQDMVDYLSADSQITTKTTLAQAHATLSGDFGVTSPLASNPIGFAVGGEYRKYTASIESDLLSQANDLGGAGGAQPNVSGGFDVYEAYGELIAPLIEDRPFAKLLSVGAGVRYSSYSVDAANSPSYDTWTYKFEGSWAPVADVKFRGNYSRAVRAPNVSELFTPVTTGLTNLGTDPCAGSAPLGNANLAAVCIAQGAPASTIGFIEQPSAAQANASSGGNLDIKPETSDSWGVGATFTPTFLPGFNASIDYYNIKVKDAITTPTPGDAIAACFDNITAASATSAACTVIGRAEDGSLNGTATGLYLPLSNLGKLKTDGIDLSLNYKHEFDFATLTLGFNGNWTNSSKFQATPTSLNRDCVGYYSVNCASIQPKFQWSQRTTFTFGDVDLSLLWRHINKVKYEPAQLQADMDAADAINRDSNGVLLPVDQQDCPDYAGADAGGCVVDSQFRKIKSYDYFDLTARAQVSDNVTLTFTVMNMFDKKPPILGGSVGSTSYNSGNTYPSTYDALGRKFAVSAKMKF
ncbi:TonB-dependent receptor domain-containing protein [Sphingobium yanoikuyae]|uniref:TonB-dependent receptor n=1 Tax=Sphingobium yanoikuyae TaxID=13690 RepID=A0A430BSU9_SPHYA|nr:TonB-dependent receptor [Sphingobium yanoikuyae]RSU55781.1 TonB-dependent receptor [Sphingobium yanoikuyae]